MKIRFLGSATVLAFLVVPAAASAQTPSRAEYDCANFGECGEVAAKEPTADAATGGRVSGSTRGMNISGRLGKKVTEAPVATTRPARDKSGLTTPQKSTATVSGAKPRMTAPAVKRPVATAAATRVRLAQGITFMTGSSELTPSARANVDVLAESLLRADKLSTRFRIEGHTDAVGDAAANKELSDRRAAAVAAYLVSKGVSPSRLETVGLGETSLLQGIAPHAAANRRVESKLIN